jgi:hypothetical protein
MKRVFRHALRALLGAVLAWAVLTLARATAAPAAEIAAPAEVAAPASVDSAAPADSTAPVHSTAPSVDATAIVAIEVVDDSTGAPVPFANLVLVDPQRRFLGSEQGTFRLELPAGTHRARIVHVAYRTTDEMSIAAAPGDSLSLRVAMSPLAHSIPEVEVSAAGVPSARVAASGVRTLNPAELAAIPNLRDDPFLALRVLPGVATEDVGAEFHMRGGGIHETLVRIDGMEVRELFHGRDFGGITGIVPVGVVDGMDVYLGGFPAQYGGKMSGVIDVDLRSTGRSGFHAKAGVDAVSARVLAEAHGAKSSGFLSVREGYLDRVLAAVQDEAVIQPAYRDLLLRGVRRISPSQSISLNYLRSEDHLLFEDEVERHFVNADYVDHAAWSTWKRGGVRHLLSGTVSGALSRQLRKVGVEGRDDHELVRLGARLDTGLQATESHLVKLGAQVDRETGSSFVRSEEVVSIAADGTVGTIEGFEGERRVDRTRAAAYVQDDWRPVPRFALSAGARASYDTDSEDLLVGPRASASFLFGGSWTLTGAWGIYDQAPDLGFSDQPELRLESQETSIAEHVLIGLQRSFGATVLGVDAYAKDFRRLDGVVERTYAGEIQRSVVTRGGSNGVEAFLHRTTPGLSFWLTYTVAKSEWGDGERTFLRDFDQRHMISLANTFRFGESWDLGTSYVFHSGRPHTVQNWKRDAQRGVWVLSEGPTNGARLPSYHRLDLRLRRHFEFERWRMSIYAEGLNLTNHDNVMWYSWGFEVGENGTRPVRSARTGLPALPTLGIEVEF